VARTRAVPLAVDAVGTVEASSTVDIHAQVTGQLDTIHFAEGQDIAKGAPLFTLDARPFQAALRQAQAVLARDSSQAANARTQLDRYTNLLNRGLLPRDQYDTQVAGVSALEATVEADRAAAETARLNLQFAEIRSPVAGRTGALGVHMGDLVRANDTAPMVVINQLSPILVTFAVPGRLLGEIRRYAARSPLRADVRMADSQADAPLDSGTVTFIDNAVDPTTGSIRMKASFSNRDRALWPGLFVRVRLTLATDPNALVIPAVAVQTGQHGSFVYVVRQDATVEVRPVTLDRQVGAEAVVARGLNAGEQVVTDGQLRLVPGARVSPRAS
jgi:membrane fusion protein, multidrug efflux system